ncbi:unnamed protein product (macronuclear) [Paramecium tetraurelia]|uniref:Uncharacterized protein n=1 Tax=Paramecium tetraurelia TaxID=5888 RepID=A0DWT7_PARTE|nr:uncharacterized protein GSPATT00021147001 [Paramecium tetraurelia]CAK87504.1 unnamed protein product [Paramecium tetraurelia]|eukprot:XP_001454901.1 hypothetical protein (macronuclear) [Paramecium tetraurelia strain d4-2]
MISEDLEIDLLTSSNVDSDNDFTENKKQHISQNQTRVCTKTKRGRPPRQKKKAPNQKTLTTEERKIDESPDIIMIGSSKAKMAKANTIMKKIKKKFTAAKKHKQQQPERQKAQKHLKAKTNKAQSKFQSVVQSFKTFLNQFKENMKRALDEGDKILKEIEQ